MDFCNNTELLKLFEEFNTTGRDLEASTVKKVYTILCYVYLSICLIGIIFNSLLVCLSGRNREVNRSPILLLSWNLALTDSLALLFNMISIYFNSYRVEVVGDKSQDLLCLMMKLEIVKCAAMISSALHLLAMALLQYRGVVDPLHYK